jgi:hypothetical protein
MRLKNNALLILISFCAGMFIETNSICAQQNSPDNSSSVAQGEKDQPIKTPAESSTGTESATQNALAAFDSTYPASLSAKLQRAKKRLTGQKFLLRYQFAPGQSQRWQIEHSTSTETRISGKHELSRSHGLSTKRWFIKSVEKDGSATIVYSMDDAEMWHQIGDQTAVSYSSRTSKSVPDEYAHIAETIGIPLASVRIDAAGNVLEKSAIYRDINLGMSEFSIAFPKEAIEIGHQWNTTSEFNARMENGGQKRIKTRLVYQLVSVDNDFATISRNVEVLTPIEEPGIMSQIAQHITKGSLEFDIKQGRLLEVEIRWDESVQGFSTPDSFMKYLGKWTQTFVPADQSASVQKVAFIEQEGESLSRLRGPDDKPLIRRH